MHVTSGDTIIPMRWQSASASSMEWVVKTTVVVRAHASTISQISLRTSGSRPVVGSSRNTTFGFPSSAIAMESRRRSPPDRLNEGIARSLSRDTLFSAALIDSAKASRGIPFRRA